MPTTTIYRPATENDVAVIATLLSELSHAEGGMKEVDPMALAGGLFARDRKMDLAAHLAIVEQEVVGVVLYYIGYDVLTTSYGYHLADIFVRPAYRRQGIGRGLFAALAARNLAQGGEWISLTVLNENKHAQSFYKKLNMTQVPVQFFAGGKNTLVAIAKKAARN